MLYSLRAIGGPKDMPRIVSTNLDLDRGALILFGPAINQLLRADDDDLLGTL